MPSDGNARVWLAELDDALGESVDENRIVGLSAIDAHPFVVAQQMRRGV